MKAFAEGGTVWDYDHLSSFLTAPKAVVKGTAMGFAGVKKPDERANLIAYLRTLSDNPAPLPEAAAPAPRTPPRRPKARLPRRACPRRRPPRRPANLPRPRLLRPRSRRRPTAPHRRLAQCNEIVIVDIMKKPGSARLFC